MHAKRAQYFKALGVESRIRIIELLKENGPMCVTNLADILGISPSAVSQHLKVLKYSGMVSDERQGYFIPYDIEVEVLEQCGEMLSDVCKCDCQGPDPVVKVKMKKSSDKMALLKDHEKTLRKELERIRKEIGKLKKKG